LVKPIKVKRLALRYINRIEISSTGDLGEYMQTLPTLGPSLPNEILNLFMRVEVPFGDTTMAIVTQTVVPRVEGATERDLILDVDAVSTKEFSPKDEQLWVEFAKLREVKNTCFFGSLLDSTWRKYQ